MAQIVNFSFLTTNRSHNAREDAPPPDLTPLFQTYLTDLLEQAETYASPLTKRGAAKLREQLD